MDTAVIIPAYNEEKHIQNVLRKAKKQTPFLIVVDDGSQDKTAAIATEEGAQVLRHSVNLGKGAALKTGCDYAYKKGAKNIIVLDADGQHDPELIPLFTELLKEQEMVFGYRTLSEAMPGVLRFGNWAISKITMFLYGVQLPDTQCGYRAFTADAYKKIRWKSSDYSLESEMIANVSRYKLRYTRIPIQTYYADKYKGTTVYDGVKIVAKMISWRVFK